MPKSALEKAMAARQREFETLRKGGGTTLPNLIDLCERLTTMAEDEFAALAKAAEASFALDQEVHESLYHSTLEEMARLTKQAEQMTESGTATRGDKAYIQIMETTYRLRCDRLKAMSDQQAREHRQIAAFAQLLPKEILSKRASTFAKDAFWAGFHTAAGALPFVGVVYSASKASVDVVRKKGERARTATEVVNALEDYANALSRWIVAARLLTGDLEARVRTAGQGSANGTSP